MKKALNQLEARHGLDYLADLSRRLVVTSYAALVLLLTLSILWWYPPAEGARWWVILAIQILPLVAFAPALIKQNPRMHAWLCFVVLFYFMQGTTTAFYPHKFWLGLIEAILAGTLFVSAMLYTRWRARQLKQQAGEQ
ncbi:Uncharacterized membrane protein [Allopseudospirillum japonicum]|uniref:Uncharacterized membrane protein n=1 Tax=Allopseudospirillum japonicum TaxID=64971 RepID=A0A1H6Q0B9_9GAMM|nr:DUF2069 domain-containing protein [Allopseudospirillum japonicum]SEI37298.1 Uncharacterized membrane protein [Allopseudospirillum japonicum]